MVSPALLLVPPDKLIAVAAAQHGEHQGYAADNGPFVVHCQHLRRVNNNLVRKTNRFKAPNNSYEDSHHENNQNVRSKQDKCQPHNTQTLKTEHTRTSGPSSLFRSAFSAARFASSRRKHRLTNFAADWREKARRKQVGGRFSRHSLRPVQNAIVATKFITEIVGLAKLTSMAQRQ